MIFDDITHKVLPESIENKDQATVYWYFLDSEELRHMEDVWACMELKDKIKELWKLEVE